MNFIAQIYYTLNLLFAKTYCPVCGSKNAFFSPLPDYYREHAERYGYPYFGQGEMIALDTYFCKKCHASDRERAYALWMSAEQRFGCSFGSRALHFAPESALSSFIREKKFFAEYLTADMSMPDVDHQIDIMDMPFEDEGFDFFICSHILEHVVDDRVAIGELFRVTAKGGRGILVAPIIPSLSATLEDPSIADEGERWRLFGQYDHVRLYAHGDYVKRLEASGFSVSQLGVSYFGAKLFQKLGLKESSILYIVSKK